MRQRLVGQRLAGLQGITCCQRTIAGTDGDHAARQRVKPALLAATIEEVADGRWAAPDLPENAGEDSFSFMPLLKGEDRPINMLADRMAVAAALSMIEVVTFFEDDTPLELILTCKPDVLVKGGDWPVDQIVGSSEVRSWGGTVHSIPFLHERSTTAMLKKIRS